DPSAGPLTPNEVLATKTIIGVNTRWKALHEQGLIGPGTVIRISPEGVEQARRSTEFFTIDPRSFPVRTESEWFSGGAGITVGTPPINPGPQTNYNTDTGSPFPGP